MEYRYYESKSLGRRNIDGRRLKAGRRKLTEEQVKSIRSQWPDKSQAQLAREFKVDPSCIHRIVNNFTWAF